MNAPVSRRNLLAAAPFMGLAAAMAGATPVAALCATRGEESPVMQLFRQWEAGHKMACDKSLSDEEADALGEDMSRIEEAMMIAPSRSAQDVAAKVCAWTAFGDFPLDNRRCEAFWAEARALVA